MPFVIIANKKRGKNVDTKLKLCQPSEAECSGFGVLTQIRVQTQIKKAARKSNVCAKKKKKSSLDLH